MQEVYDFLKKCETCSCNLLLLYRSTKRDSVITAAYQYDGSLVMGNITASLKEAAPGKESNGIHCGCYSALIVADQLIL